MTVKRIVPNIDIAAIDEVRDFYEHVLGLKAVMDHGWIVTLASDARANPQLSIASEGGAGTPVPDISIEVDHLDLVYEKARASGCEIVYELCHEDWGVRRFFVRDPAGKVLNILTHDG